MKKNNYNLFLDDQRIPLDVSKYINPKTYRYLYTEFEWKVVRNYNEFVKTIKTLGLPILISFDHDLGDIPESSKCSEKTGYDCAKWLKNYCEEKNLKCLNG